MKAAESKNNEVVVARVNCVKNFYRTVTDLSTCF